MKTAWQILHGSLKLYAKDRPLFLGYSAWLLIPVLLFLLVDLLPIPTGLSATIQFVISIAQAILGIWIVMAIISLAVGAKEKPAESGKVGEDVLPMLPAFVWAELLAAIRSFLALLLLIVPGIILWARYAFVGIMVLVEGKRGKEALAASRALVIGRTGIVLWRMIAGQIMILIIYLIITVILFSILSTLGAPSVNVLTSTSAQIPPWAEALLSVVEVVILPLPIIYMVEMYKELKAQTK